VISGAVRLDRRTKRLVGRLRPGEIAVIDHVDLDRVAADSLVAAGVAAVLNAKPSVSGRYPNLGPEVLIQAGIPLVDDLGEELFDGLREGDSVRIEGDTVLLAGEPVAQGRRQDAETVAKAMADAREGLSVQLEAFAANTMEYLKQERDLLLDGVGVPEIETKIAGRHCLIVVRGYDYKADLEVLRPYIREFKPVLIGVDGGADALVEAGYTPDMIVGDMDSVSDDVLRCGAEVVVHAYPDGRAPGLARVHQLGVAATSFPAAAPSDAAGRREGRDDDRRGGHPRDPRRVPGQGPRRHGIDLPDPAQGRRQVGGREGRQPAVPAQHVGLVAAAARAVRDRGDGVGRGGVHRREGLPRCGRRVVGQFDVHDFLLIEGPTR
jgi:uncharacterized membrane-anchored protein